MDSRRLRLKLLPAMALALTVFGPACRAASGPAIVALAPFEYRDTSGELRDQSAVHQARLETFMHDLRTDLQASGRYDLLALTCGVAQTCGPENANASALLRHARRAGATLLLLGGIHKMSTLVQYARVEAIDVSAGTILFDHIYTFRGDTDEAWRHAETFIASDVLRVLAHPAPASAR